MLARAMPAQEVAKTAQVPISTIHVWRCGQRLLRELVSAGAVPPNAIGQRGQAVFVASPDALAKPQVAAFVEQMWMMWVVTRAAA